MLSLRKKTSTLKHSRHEGAVWCVSWVRLSILARRSSSPPTKSLLTFHLQAHPKYGNILASSSYDGKVLIWREASAQWTKVADFALHTASVNIVSWSPHECGCLLACASSDGMVSVLEFSEGNWGHTIFQAHAMGVNAVSWAPAMMPGSLVSSKPELGSRRRFVTGGSDCVVKVWDWKYAPPFPLRLDPTRRPAKAKP